MHKLRGNVSVLEGSGGNIAVLTGPNGKLVVDAGIGVSRPRMTKALAYSTRRRSNTLINSHWHFDHTDGNEWLNSVGAKITAQDNTRKHLADVQALRTGTITFFPPAPAGALPTIEFASEKTLRLNGATLALPYYPPAHTDSDISVEFTEADIATSAIPFGTAISRSSIIQPAAASTE